MNNKKIIIIIIIAICAGVAFYSIYSGRGLTPYVSFKNAIESGDYVQVIGKADKSIPFEQKEGVFSFNIKESASSLREASNTSKFLIYSMRVVFNGAKPNNFDSADQVVVQVRTTRKRRYSKQRKYWSSARRNM